MTSSSSLVPVAGLLLLTAALTIAAEPGVTIVPATKVDGGSSQGGGGKQYDAFNTPLSEALVWLHPDGVVSGGDVAALPPGGFDIKMNGYELKSQASFDALAAKIKAQFGVTVQIVEQERNGLTLDIPADAKVTRGGEEDNYTIATSGKGWSLKAATGEQIARWLGRELDQPVTATGDANARFTFDVENSVFNPEKLPDALRALGIRLTPTKIKVKVLRASK